MSPETTMRVLAPTLHNDFMLLKEMEGRLDTFRNVQADTLLLGGPKPAWLKASLRTLQTVLPNVRRIEFSGLDHGGSGDESTSNRSGEPERVAAEMRRFFS